MGIIQSSCVICCVKRRVSLQVTRYIYGRIWQFSLRNMGPTKGHRKFLATFLITFSICVIQILFQSATGSHSRQVDFLESPPRILVRDEYYVGLYEIND